MITVIESRKLVNIPFDEYLKIDAKSNSFLKSQVGGISPNFTPTEKVLKGKMLDAMLTDEVPENFDFYNEMRILYGVINKHYPQVKVFEKQVSYLSTFEYQGFQMNFKGRLDFEFADMVIDLKYTEEKKSNFRSLIKFIKYDNQVWAYSKAAKKSKAFILMINNKAEHELIQIPLTESNQFYEEQIINFGTFKNK
jgi:hypothetical protein